MTKNILLAASLAIVALLSVTAAQEKPAPHAPEIPIGGVILWWGRAADIPEGFEACDGTVVSTKDAVLKGAKPNMQNKFVRGAENYRSFVPTEYSGGGSDTINVKGAIDDHKFKIKEAELPAHAHTVKEHTHDVGAHTHDVAAHHHKYDQVTVQDNAAVYFKTGVDGDADSSSLVTQKVTVTPLASDTEPKPLKTAKNADGLKSGPASLTTNPTGAGAEVTLTHTGRGTFDNKPAYLDMVFLIRVK